MKKMKFALLYLSLSLLLMMSACEQEEIMTYDTAYSAVNFVSSSVEYSFLTNTEDEYIQTVEVQILGAAADHDRTFAVEVIDSLTTATADQYEIVGGVVKANEFKGTLSVKLFNSPELADTTITVAVKLIDSEDFNKGNVETNLFTIKWSDQVVIPDWRYVKYFFCATSSTEAYRVLVASTGLLKFDIYDYRAYGMAGAVALGTQYGDYIMQWNLDHPDNHLKHDDGTKAGEDIVPKYYTQSKFN